MEIALNETPAESADTAAGRHCGGEYKLECSECDGQGSVEEAD